MALIATVGILGGCGNHTTPIPKFYNKNIEYKDSDFTQRDKALSNNLQNKVLEIKQERNKPKYRTEEAIITYYTASDDECGKGDGITASGTVATEGRTIASDHLPFGTIVEIDDVKYVVEDRFGGGYNNKIDVFVNNKHTAYKLGKRKVEVKIYE